MNKELKEQARDEFIKIFCSDKNGVEHLIRINKELIPVFQTQNPYDFMIFIDSLIDKTVQQTEERLVGAIESKKKKHTPQTPIEARMFYNEALRDVTSLIINKSDINKDKE